MVVHSPAKILGQPNIEDHLRKGCQYIAARGVRNEPLPVAPEGVTVRRLGNKLTDVHNSIEALPDTLCKAFDISWETTLIAPAFRKLALLPLAHQSG